VLTPDSIAAHWALRSVTFGSSKDSEVRSVVVVGVNEVGLKFANVCKQHPNLFMQVLGFFDDRAKTVSLAAIVILYLGKWYIPASRAGTRVKMIFISQPISAQPRIHKLLDECRIRTFGIFPSGYLRV
jgi:putative colanic acid biosynthesis UDP-glucose lipid carrier transferase